MTFGRNIRRVSSANTTQSPHLNKAVSDLSSMFRQGTYKKNSKLRLLYEDKDGLTGYYSLKGEEFSFSLRDQELTVVA